MTNAFQTRHKANLANVQLRDSIRDVLNEIDHNNSEKKNAYKDYLSTLRKITPWGKENALTAYEIAARLSDNETECNSIVTSIAKLERAAFSGSKTFGTHSSFPGLRKVKKETVRHFAEMDNQGNIIRKWDCKTTTHCYYQV